MEQGTDSPTSVVHPLPYASPGIEKPRVGFMISRSVGWPLVIFAMLLTGLSLYAVSGPSAYLLSFLAAAIGWIGALGWWGIKAIVCLGDAVRRNPHAPRSWWKFFAVPFLFVMTVILAAEDLPAKVTFRIARPSMERIARAQMSTPDGAVLMHNVNVYGPCEFKHDGNSVTVWVRDAGYLDSEGYAYCPAGRPSASGRTTPISDAWYAWYLRF